MADVGVLLGLCAVWFGAVYVEGGTAYLDNLLVKQTAGRAVDAFHHKAPWWYYGVSIWYSLAPWSLLVIGVLGWVLWSRRRRTEAGELERLFWIVAFSTLAVLSMISSKIQIYLLPAFPFFVYGAVLAMSRLGTRRWMSWLVGIPAGCLYSSFRDCSQPRGFCRSCRSSVRSSYRSAGRFSRWRRRGRSYGSFADGSTRPSPPWRGMARGDFIISFAVPQFNGHIGMGDVCGAARTVGEAAGIENYYTYDIRRAENIDVYLGRPVELIDSAEELAGVDRGIVITRKQRIGNDSTLTRVFAGQEVHRVGNYAFGVIHKNDDER